MACAAAQSFVLRHLSVVVVLALLSILINPSESSLVVNEDDSTHVSDSVDVKLHAGGAVTGRPSHTIVP